MGCGFGGLPKRELVRVAFCLTVLGRRPITIEHGERLAQMVVAAVPEVAFRDDDTLGERPVAGRRNDGGFGSTGQ